MWEKRQIAKCSVYWPHWKRNSRCSRTASEHSHSANRVFFLLNNKKNNFWSYFAPLINDSFSFWAFWQPLLKLNGVDNVAFKFYIKHTENETKKQEGDFICTVSAVTEFGVSGSFIGLLTKLCTAKHSRVHRPLSVSPCVTDFLCAGDCCNSKKHKDAEPQQPFFTILWWRWASYGVIEIGTAEPQPDNQLLALSK